MDDRFDLAGSAGERAFAHGRWPRRGWAWWRRRRRNPGRRGWRARWWGRKGEALATERRRVVGCSAAAEPPIAEPAIEALGWRWRRGATAAKQAKRRQSTEWR